LHTKDGRGTDWLAHIFEHVATSEDAVVGLAAEVLHKANLARKRGEETERERERGVRRQRGVRREKGEERGERGEEREG
jgi:hypothetical protein